MRIQTNHPVNLNLERNVSDAILDDEDDELYFFHTFFGLILYSIIFWRHKWKYIFYFNLKVFPLVLNKFLLFNSKQFGNWFEENINLSKLEKTIPCGQVMWFCLAVLNLSFYRFEKKTITSIWFAKIAKFLKKFQPQK